MGLRCEANRGGNNYQIIPELIVKARGNTMKLRLFRKTPLDIYALQIVVRWEDILDGNRKKKY